MVDSLGPDDWERLDDARLLYELYSQAEIEEYLTFWDTSKHKVKWGKSDRGKQRYKEVTPKGLSSNTRKLARELNKVNVLEKQIEDATAPSDLPRNNELNSLKMPTNKIKESRRIKVRQLEQIEEERIAREEELIVEEENIREVEKEERRLIKKGKMEQLFRSRIIDATSESEIESILSDAEDDLSGASVSRLRENAQWKISQLERE